MKMHCDSMTLLLLLLMALLSAFADASPSSPSSSSSSSPSLSPPPAAPSLEFDFIVVGGGSSGGLVAARLAQAGHSVLLLEAGSAMQAGLGGRMSEPHWETIREQAREKARNSTDTLMRVAEDAPLDAVRLPTVFDLPLEWGRVLADSSVSRRFEFEISGSPAPPVARGLGGCGAHNALIYMRGVDEDYDGPPDGEAVDGEEEVRWPADWSWQHVQPFFQRSVHQHDRELAQREHYKPAPMDVPCSDSDSKVPLQVGSEVHLSSLLSEDVDPVARRLLAAWTEASTSPSGSDSASPLLPFLRDFNEPTRREGAGLYQFVLRDGRRSTGVGELLGMDTPEETRRTLRTLDVRTDSQALRLTYAAAGQDEQVPRVDGVEFVVFPFDSFALDAEPESDEPPTGDEGVPPVPRAAKPQPRHSRVLHARARREVILTAGALHTPKLLQLSGIGPRQLLESHGIPVVSELRGVGDRLLDGAKVMMQFRVPSIRWRTCMFDRVRRRKDGTASHRKADDEHARHCEEERVKWMEGQLRVAGLKASQSVRDVATSSAESDAAPFSFGEFGTPGFSLGVFFRSSPHHRLPNIQLTVFPFDGAQRDWTEGGARLKDVQEEQVMSVEVFLNQPKSRGNVTLQRCKRGVKEHILAHLPTRGGEADSDDDLLDAALCPPLVNWGGLSHPSDISDLVTAVRQVRQLFASPSLADFVTEELVPGVHVQSDDELAEFVRCGPREFRKEDECDLSTRMTLHLAGTARMTSRARTVDELGLTSPSPPSSRARDTQREDDGSVVDSHLRVHGVRGLRVADASAMPRLPSGNTQAAVMMLAERCASMVIDDYPTPHCEQVQKNRVEVARQRQASSADLVTDAPHPLQALSGSPADDSSVYQQEQSSWTPSWWGAISVAAVAALAAGGLVFTRAREAQTVKKSQ